MPVDEMSRRDCRTVKSITARKYQLNMKFYHKSCFKVKIITSDPFNYITIGLYIYIYMNLIMVAIFICFMDKNGRE